MESRGCSPLGVQKLNFFRIFLQVFAIAEHRLNNFLIPIFFLCFCRRTNNRPSVQFCKHCNFLRRPQIRFPVSTSVMERMSGRTEFLDASTIRGHFDRMYTRRNYVSFIEHLYLKRTRDVHMSK